jgi:hypothetical protein
VQDMEHQEWQPHQESCNAMGVSPPNHTGVALVIQRRVPRHLRCLWLELGTQGLNGSALLSEYATLPPLALRKSWLKQ